MNVALCTLFGSQRHIHDNPDRGLTQRNPMNVTLYWIYPLESHIHWIRNEADEGLGAGVVRKGSVRAQPTASAV
jgi:hypothetical protein